MNVTSAISQICSTKIHMARTRSAAKTIAIIVAHPGDETLWAGGTMMVHSSWKCYVVCLSSKDDEERALRFHKALKILNAQGIIGDLNDEAEPKPLDEDEVEQMIISLLPPWHFDLIITHSPGGEYTRHIRHEETGKAVINLWYKSKLSSNELWTFAYEDGNKEYYPRPIKKASIYKVFSILTWFRKYRILTRTYGLKTNSFEARTTPFSESFWQYKNPNEAYKVLNQFENFQNNSFSDYLQ